MSMKLKVMLASIGAIAVSFATLVSAQDACPNDDGNRYDKPRCYHSEISAAEAYAEMMKNDSVLIDVRRLREYAAGHPERAFNVPYPHVVDSNDQDPLTLYWEVYDIVKGKTDTPITTLCRTGSRSVDAGNILANPDSNLATAGLEPFTNVRNIWEGFVGQYKYAYAGGTIKIDPDTGEVFPLDLNNNGEMDLDVADVYPDVDPPSKDANPDKGGWRNFQQLPWTTKIKRKRAYLQDRSQYEQFQD